MNCIRILPIIPRIPNGNTGIVPPWLQQTSQPALNQDDVYLPVEPGWEPVCNKTRLVPDRQV
jgi:hypothetical protein